MPGMARKPAKPEIVAGDEVVLRGRVTMVLDVTGEPMYAIAIHGAHVPTTVQMREADIEKAPED